MIMKTKIVFITFIIGVSIIYIKQDSGGDYFSGYKKNMKPSKQTTTAHGIGRKKVERKSASNNNEVFFIGVKKCGTTALKYFMSSHPDVTPLYPNPHACDSSIKKFKMKIDTARKSGKLVLVSDNRCFHNIESFDKFKRPPKIVVLLCNPALRAFSDYKHLVRKNRLNAVDTTFPSIVKRAITKLNQLDHGSEDFRDYIAKLRYEGHLDYTIVSMSIYYEFLREFYNRYNSKDILLLSGEELKEDPASVIDNLQDFLNLRKFIQRDMFFRSNATGFYCLKLPNQHSYCKHTKQVDVPPPDERSLKKLREFYKPFNKMLYQLTNRTFSWL